MADLGTLAWESPLVAHMADFPESTLLADLGRLALESPLVADMSGLAWECRKTNFRKTKLGLLKAHS